MTTDYPFPLPAGHFYGHTGFDLSAHDGRGSIRDLHGLMEWQRQYSNRWGDRDLVATGHYGGPTQRAALRVQREAGLRLTGNVDAETWTACLTLGAAAPAAAPPTIAEQLEVEQRRSERARKSAANKKAHELSIAAREKDRVAWKAKSTPGTEYARPGCPVWWPGREFGPGERGEHVTKVYRILGMSPRKEFGDDLAERIRGFRVANGLQADDVVDLPTAKLLDTV